MSLNIIRNFFKMESASGITLLIAALFAFILDNSPASSYYHALLDMPLSIQVSNYSISKSILSWINEGVITLFFLVVGLELKREFLEGHLSDKSAIALPIFAALGGMLIPALIYIFFNHHDAMLLKGWAIPAATDTAFTLGILSLFGHRIPIALKMFLMALAIFDDMGAIIVIALFHTSNLSLFSLNIGFVAIIGLLLLNIFHVHRAIPYMILGAILWVCVLKSGVHATLSGLIVALTIPLRTQQHTHGLLIDIENTLHPWVAFFVMPIFAFANTGVKLEDISFETFLDPLSLGIIFGLFIGKQIGIFSFTWVLIKTGYARLPHQTSWAQLYAGAVLCGIGFTMSLFISELAFGTIGDDFLEKARLSILTGSLISAILGYSLLHWTSKKRDDSE